MSEAGHRGDKAVNIGLAANIILALLKTFIGIIGHSAALLADGINSVSDVAYYIVVKVFMKLANKPADTEHPYGHRQLESIAALVVGSFVITTAIAIFWDSINNVYDMLTGRQTGGMIQLATLWVALFTVVVKIVLTFFTHRVGVRTGNAAVLALAYDHRNDAWSAGGAAIGIFLGRSGLAWGDPLVGAIVAIIILQTGIEILRESSSDLMDTVPGESLDRKVRGLLAENSDVKEVGEIQAHRFGPYLVINVQIAIDGKLSLAEGDAIAERVEKRLSTGIELVRRVYVHYHPVGSSRNQQYT
ncbi:MAG: cation diffusion facilitator family transporter [Kiritimatiellae bacterium]|nr:cation diffusion facilitator family transporter [Kiritimatiellia bacterium]